MISQQKQVAVLKKLIAEELRKSAVRENMLKTLSKNGQEATGRLETVINRMRYTNMVRLRNTLYSQDGYLVYFTVVIEFQYGGAPYAKFLDKKESKSGDSYSIFPSGRQDRLENIISWIKNKKPSSWKTDVDLSEEGIKKFAFFLNKKLRDNKNNIKNQSDFISGSKSRAQRAVEKGTDKFVDYLGTEIFRESISTLNKISL